jgi:CheY-like chemotaxis protein
MNKTRNSPLVSNGKDTSSQASEQRGRRILVVDDEEVIADTITKILSLRGYAATAAYDGDSALEAPHLLLTDVLLPGMNGIELAQTVRRIFPDCKILLFSGQASTVDLMASADRSGHRFTLLNKPVPPAQLLALVAEQLNLSATAQ